MPIRDRFREDGVAGGTQTRIRAGGIPKGPREGYREQKNVFKECSHSQRMSRGVKRGLREQ